MSTNSFARRISVCALVAGALGLHVPSSYAADTFEPNNTLPDRDADRQRVAACVVHVHGRGQRLLPFTSPARSTCGLIWPSPTRWTIRSRCTTARVTIIGSSSGFGAGVDERFDMTLAAGVYYIRVSGSPHDDVNSYTLTLTAPLPGDDFEPNNTQATAAAAAARDDNRRVPLHVQRCRLVPHRHDRGRRTSSSRSTFPKPSTTTLTLRDGLGRMFSRIEQLRGRPGRRDCRPPFPPGPTSSRSGPPASYSQGQRYSLTATSGAFTDSFEPNNTRASARRVGPGNPAVQGVYLRTTRTGIGSTCLRPGPSASCWKCRRPQTCVSSSASGSGSFIASSSNSGLGVDESMVRTLTGPGAYLRPGDRVFRPRHPKTTL